MTFAVDWIKAKLAEGPIQRQDCDADPEDPDGEENVEDSPSIIYLIPPQVVPGDTGCQSRQGTKIHIGCNETL